MSIPRSAGERVLGRVASRHRSAISSPDGENDRLNGPATPRQPVDRPRAKTERWDPIGKARGERRSPRIRSDFSDPQRVVAVSWRLFGGRKEVTGVSGVLQTPFRPRIGFVPPGLVLLDEASRACPPVFLGEDRSLKVPHRTRTGVVIHADRR